MSKDHPKKVVEHGLPVQQAEETPQPPFSTPPGIKPTGIVPLQPGRPITVSKPTAMELQTLKEAGWQEGEPVPENIAAFIQQAKQIEKAQETEPEVQLPSSSPPMFPGVPYQQELSEAQRTATREALEQSRAEVERLKTLEAAQIPGAGAGVNEAIQAAKNASAADKTVIVDDTASADYDSGPSKTSEEPREDETGAYPTPQRCPRCDWDINVQDVVTVTDGDKQRFLQSLLGSKPFQKAYRLFNGALLLLVRSLTPGELDMCFEQCFREQKRGELETPDTYFEQVNRYRLCLQLVRMETMETVHAFPESIDGWTKTIQPSDSEATKEWEKDLPVKRIYEEIYDTAITSETLNRVVAGVTAEFNSLVAKLEANAVNPNFWSTAK